MKTKDLTLISSDSLSLEICVYDLLIDCMLKIDFNIMDDESEISKELVYIKK